MTERLNYNKPAGGTSQVVQSVVKNPPSKARVTGSSLGQGDPICHGVTKLTCFS